MPISKVRHNDKRKLLKLCQDKEKAGFECVKPVRKVFAPHKYFNLRDGRHEFKETDYDVFYEAVYKK